MLRRGLIAFTAATAPRNEYYVLRHGQSLANVEGIISSDPQRATREHGLSDEGREQAARAASAFAEVCKGRHTAIFTSDFLRAQETAEIAFTQAAASHAASCFRDGVVPDTRLRERWFGDFDGTSVDNYKRVWLSDARDANHVDFNVERVNSVAKRTCKLLSEIEQTLPAESAPWVVLLVAHGDVLQIMLTAAAQRDPRSHREQEHLETAVLRPLDIVLPSEGSDSLNEAYSDYMAYYDGQLTKGWKS